MNIKRNSKRKFIVVVASAGLLFGLISPPKVEAMEYLGEYCFSFTFNENQQGPINPITATARFGITHTGDNYYLLQGRADNSIFSSIASASYVGDYFTVTTSNTYESSNSLDREARIGQFKLDANTLSGTVWRVITKFNGSTRSMSEYYQAGTVTLIPCP